MVSTKKVCWYWLPSLLGLLDVVSAVPQPLHRLAATGGSRQVVLSDQERGGEASAIQAQEKKPKLHGRFLHITDFHPDEFYKVHSSTQEDYACHRGKGPAGFYGAETSDCDTPISLVNATFDWIGANLKDQIDFVIWTGDSARHDSDLDIPRSSSQVLRTNRLLVDKFVETFTSDKEPRRLTVPIVPTFGNNDVLPHNILLPGPNKWLQHYTEIWKPFIPEEQRHSFEFGGWFDIEVVPNHLVVFSLNSLYFFDRNAGVDGCTAPSEPGFKQMEWLRIQLERLRDRGMKAILMSHIPPARTDSKQLWDESCWQKYNLWLRQFRDVIVGSVYGHMNIDHFVLHDTKDLDLTLAGGTEEDQKKLLGLDFGDDDVDNDQDDQDLDEEGQFSVMGKDDYLQELRDEWSKLPPVNKLTIDMDEVDTAAKRKKRKGKKGKKRKGKPIKEIGGKWAERYHISLISPSIVPNYFPTIRVVEYNISGLDTDIKIWADVNPAINASVAMYPPDMVDEELEEEIELAQKKEKKGKSGKKPKHPNLVVPNPPDKSSPPGPAYSPQLLSLTGYTQYYANLTHINGDIEGKTIGTTNDNDDGDDDMSIQKWRDGIHGDKKPKHAKPQPKEFVFEVEYDTFTDKIYKLKDLTVKSYVKLASRIAKRPAKGKALGMEPDFDEDFEDVLDDEEESPELVDADDDVESEEEGHDEADAQGKKKKKKKKGGKKHKKKNKVWLHFLEHAFVSTEDEKSLKKLDS